MAEGGGLGDGLRDDTPLRVLCLHGYNQSASAMRSRLAQLQRKLRARVTFDFLQVGALDPGPRIMDHGP